MYVNSGEEDKAKQKTRQKKEEDLQWRMGNLWKKTIKFGGELQKRVKNEECDKK